MPPQRDCGSKRVKGGYCIVLDEPYDVSETRGRVGDGGHKKRNEFIVSPNQTSYVLARYFVFVASPGDDVNIFWEFAAGVA